MKFLINPFLWYLILQTAGLLVLLRCVTGSMRRVLGTLLFLTVLLGMASTPLSRNWLEASLEMTPTPPSATAPAFIFVLGGGYVPGAVHEEDGLAYDSLIRSLHGATIWRRYPEARLVFSGGEYAYQDIRSVDRSVQLMAEAARSRGVAMSAVVLEPRSHNTREHPVEGLKLPGVTPSTPIGLVTSGWHMRRAQREFCRYFEQVQFYPVPSEKHAVVWQDFIPEAGYFDANTTLLREWVGILWYSLIGEQGQAAKC